MRVLIISGYFYPQNTPRAFRTTELVNEFVRRGDDVALYIPSTTDDLSNFEKKEHLCIKYYRRREDEFIKSNNKIKFLYGRILTYTIEYPDIFILKDLKEALKNECMDYDLMITIASPHQIHWTLALLYKEGIKFADTWIADCGDPFMLCGTINIPRMPFFKYYEKLWCKYCDVITVPTQGAISGYYSEFHNKIQVIPQAFNFDEVKRKEYKPNAVPTFAYSGSLWPGSKDPRTLLEYLSTLQDIDFKFYIYYNTNNTQFLEKYREPLGDKLILSSFIPRIELLETLSGMDFLVNFEFSTGVQSPSKMIDYTLTGRPVLSINCDHLDKGKIQEFLSGNYHNSYSLPNIEDYNVKNVVNKMVSFHKNRV